MSVVHRPAATSAVELDAALDVEALAAVAHGAPVRIAVAATERMRASHDRLLSLLYEGRHVYGASSGVGDLRTSEVDIDAWNALQLNIVRSHACAVGPPLPETIVRGAMASRLATFCRGYSAVRPCLAELLAAMLDARVTPVVPSIGSVGASGDPVLLAHVALVLVGEGEATVAGGAPLAGAAALGDAGLTPLALQPREGLAMVNGLDFSLAAATLQLVRARRLLAWADAAAALSLEALNASLGPFEPRVQRLRGAGRHRDVAAAARAQCDGSTLVREPGDGTQDPYCVRCLPLVHGALHETLDQAGGTIDADLAAVIDNPLVPHDGGDVMQCGHFHGQRLALAGDATAASVCAVANICHARTALLLSGHRGLPRMLADDPGAQSGLMMVETTSASLVGRIRMQSSPASIHSMPVSAEQEDHVSMSWEAWRRCDDLHDAFSHIVAIELLTAAVAIGRRDGDPGTGNAARLRQLGLTDPPRGDRSCAPDLRRIAALVDAEAPGGV